MNLLAARRMAVAKLDAAGVPDARLDAVILLAHALGTTRAALALTPSQTELAPDQLRGLEQALNARAARQPISQILGARLFWGREFAVTSDVLDPRPETEILVAAALHHPFASVLDLGTGSGCILLTLLAERPEARGVGVDLSRAALLVAQRNCERLGLTERAGFVQGSWFDPVPGRFDLIISNPPYIAECEMARLSPEVRSWEPRLALTPGGDGLAAYRAICAGATAHLSPGGWLMVEIGPRQGRDVAGLFQAAGLAAIAVLPDMDGRNRVVAGRYLPETA
ncbi:peptide chain release factor N(5)-glutamine methyltransferase [Pseudorhodobacter sp.]|uniref:peptide chain release factor N(5)-glutamine methyltransferase n=1 Tax=Pseudorhodobacter sp. TaxID=1934400 RepID=UPI002649C39F|nr:peptide chain release factor N(5)-glutamine methyltransferase [Pseudorhodobacter sp.]MDN5786305.1 peptide chain release factor N(5)-glutamine methyltransferase [Pseudorhodobacter sp.]